MTSDMLTQPRHGAAPDRSRGRPSGIPMSERKVRRVVDLVRGKHVDEALAILQFDRRTPPASPSTR